MKKYNYNLQTFLNEDSISYYLLGAWMTDGCVYKSKDRPNRKSATLTSKDKDWLEIINSYVCPEKPLLIHGANCFRLGYNSTKLGDWLISKGCNERKSLTLKFPNIEKIYLPDFIRGCWDGDGSISFTKSANKGTSYQRQANFTSGSLDFCNALSNILNTIDVKCKVIPHGTIGRKISGRIITGNSCWRIVLSSGGSVYNLCKYLYDNSILSMPRKQIISQSIIDEWESKPRLVIHRN